MSKIFTIGYSTHTTETFIDLLQKNNITALADVRSYPYSRHTPQFSIDFLKKALKEVGISYVFLGKELGARSENTAYYRRGKIQYDLLAKDPLFIHGLERIHHGMKNYQIALMCAEKDPLDCHRAVLISRNIKKYNVNIEHIHSDGNLETHRAMELRMLRLYDMSENDMFDSPEKILGNAYCIHGEKIAYQDNVILEQELKGAKQ